MIRLDLPVAVVLGAGANLIVNTGAGVGDINFDNTINANGAGVETINLTAGTGAITFTGAIGATTRPGSITVNSASQVDMNNAIAEGAINIPRQILI